MEEYYFTADIDANRTLCLAPLTERRLASAHTEISDTSGYFLYERTGQGENAAVDILAHVLSPDAAFRLRQLLRMD